MDRSDEYRDDARDVEEVTVGEERTGDILGLGGAPVPKSTDDPSTEYDPEAVSQRRDRIFSDDSEAASRRTPERTAGATGVDMGAGGAGTDVDTE